MKRIILLALLALNACTYYAPGELEAMVDKGQCPPELTQHSCDNVKYRNNASNDVYAIVPAVLMF